MGIDVYAYVGIFIDVPPAETEVEPARQGCSRGCRGPISPGAKFCSECGAPTTTVRPAKMARGQLSLSDLPDHFEKHWEQPPYLTGQGKDHAIFTPQASKWGKSVEAMDSGVRSLNKVLPAQIIAEFEAEHQHLLDYIKKNHGVQPQVHWGLVTYAY